MINRLIKMGFICWFAVVQIIMGSSSVYAQSNFSVDVEPPLIEHEIVSEVFADIRQTFFATVVDDIELDSVSLFYRLKDDPSYSSVLMNRVSFSSTYIVHVPTDAESDRDIEYYIQARDKAGNRTVRGFAFNPLVREIKFEAPRPVVSTTPVATEPAVQSSSTRRNIIYVVLSVLAVGAVAVLSNQVGDNSESSDTSEACDGGMCNVTISVGQPQ